MIIDTHVHITLPEQKVLHHSLSIENYIKELDSLGGGKGIVFLNPFDDDFCCPQSFTSDALHKSMITTYSRENYRIMCELCKTAHFIGEDVFRNKNVRALELAQEYGMYAMAFLTAPSSLVQKQVDFYEQTYPDFLGYKIHPTIMMYPVDELYIDSKKTIVFHCGKDTYASPKQILDFAKSYKGNVVIAHFARFDKSALKEVSERDNVWIDISPFTFLYNLIDKKPNQLCDTWGYENKKNQANELFENLIEYVGINKVMFASDAPFGNLSKEFEFIQQLCLSKNEIKQIMKENAIVAFGLGDKI